MTRIALSLFGIALLALACGRGETPTTTEGPAVSTKGPAAAAPAAPAAPSAPQAAAPSAAAPDPQAVSCLDLVSKGRFQEAIAPCTAALRTAPNDPELQAALAKAKSQAAQMAEAPSAAANAATGAASDAAKSKVDEAAKGVTDKLQY